MIVSNDRPLEMKSLTGCVWLASIETMTGREITRYALKSRGNQELWRSLERLSVISEIEVGAKQ